MLKKEVEDFLVVCQFLNFSKAAELLGVQQAGLSKSIKRLEESLGRKLFIRTSKSLVLNEAGKVYLKHLKAMQEIEMAARSEMNSHYKSLVGKFQIGCHPILSKKILPHLISKTKDEHSLELKFDFVSSRESVAKVLRNETTIAIVASPVLYPELVIHRLWKENSGLYSIDGKIKDNLLFSEKTIDSYKFMKKIAYKRSQIIDDYTALHSVLLHGDAMGILPSPVAEEGGRLKLIKKFEPAVDICLIYRSDIEKTFALKFLIKEIIKGAN